MLFTSTILAQASGSIGGMTASRNRFGKYFRERVIPVNPNTPLQQEIHAHLTTASIQWKKQGIPVQQAWDNYAANTPVTNVFGNPTILTGFNMFVRTNVPRLQAGLPLAVAAPVTFGLPDLGAISIVGSAVAGVISLALTFDDTQPWTTDPLAGMIIRVARPVSQTVNFFKGPFQFNELLQGDATTPPTTNHIVTSQFTGSNTQRQFIAARLSDAEGRLSPTQIVQVLLA